MVKGSRHLFGAAQRVGETTRGTSTHRSDKEAQSCLDLWVDLTKEVIIKLLHGNLRNIL